MSLQAFVRVFGEETDESWEGQCFGYAYDIFEAAPVDGNPFQFVDDENQYEFPEAIEEDEELLEEQLKTCGTWFDPNLAVPVLKAHHHYFSSRPSDEIFQSGHRSVDAESITFELANILTIVESGKSGKGFRVVLY